MTPRARLVVSVALFCVSVFALAASPGPWFSLPLVAVCALWFADTVRAFRQTRKDVAGAIPGPSPAALAADAATARRHAVEYGLPTDPWTQLEGFWTACGDLSLTIDDVDQPADTHTILGHAVIPLMTNGPAAPSAVNAMLSVSESIRTGLLTRPESHRAVRCTWTLTGTAEDDHVIRALRQAGVHVAIEANDVKVAHLAGFQWAIDEAKRAYTLGWRQRQTAKRARDTSTVL